MLLNKLDVDLEGEAKQYKSFIDQSLLRLKDMHKALVALSRIVMSEEPFIEFQNQAIVEKVIEDLKKRFSGYDLNIRYKNLPSIYGTYDQMLVVFNNILENAVIYHEGDEGINIEISALKHDDKITFSIVDNGIGIEKEHQNHVFDMFCRLHSENAFGGGVGAGLTIAREIIQRHKGSIWN